jgi:hypothetical protein
MKVEGGRGRMEWWKGGKNERQLMGSKIGRERGRKIG